MAQTVHVPLRTKGQNTLIFPHRCVGCGAPNQAESTLAIKRLVMRGQRQEQLTLTYQIPHCQSCARSTRSVFLAGCIPFVIGMLLVGIVVFVATVWGASLLGLENYGRPNNANSFVLGAAAGLFSGLIGGFVFEVLARVVLLPIYGQALLRAPLLAMQLLNDSDYVAGLRAQLDKDATNLQLTFNNDAIAEEFKTLNSALLSTNT